MMPEPNVVPQHFVRGMQALELALTQVKARYDQGESTSDLKARERFAAHQSLFAVLEFIERVPAWKEAKLGFGIERLMIALTNIHEGRREPWLENPTSSRPPVPVEVSTARGRCAGLMEILMRKGRNPERTRQQAAKFIMSGLPPWALQTLAGTHGKTEITWRTVAGWRERATGKAAHGYEGYAYHHQLAGGAPTDLQIKKALAAIAAFLKRLGFDKRSAV